MSRPVIYVETIHTTPNNFGVTENMAGASAAVEENAAAAAEMRPVQRFRVFDPPAPVCALLTRHVFSQSGPNFPAMVDIEQQMFGMSEAELDAFPHHLARPKREDSLLQ